MLFDELDEFLELVEFFDEFFDIEVKEFDKDIEEKAQGIDVLLELV